MCYSSILTSEFPLSYGTVMNKCCFVLIIKSSFTTVENHRNLESLSINKPNGLFPSPGAKVIIFLTFSVISGSRNRVSATPEVSPPLHSIHHHHYSQWLIVRHNYHVLESEIVISDKFECISALSRLECKLVRNSFHSSFWFARVSLPLVSGLSSRFSWTSICVYISFWNNSLVLTRYFAASNTFLFLV